MVRDIPVETCRHILKRLIIPQRLVVEDIPRGRLEAIRGGYTEVEGRVCKTLEERCSSILTGRIIIISRKRERLVCISIYMAR